MQNRLSRREILVGAVMGGASRVARAHDRKPDFLFILADDHAGYVLGAYGNRLARTPNLDRLASEGTRFRGTIATRQSAPRRANPS
jgi:arylsulfatase A-like enzyme